MKIQCVICSDVFLPNAEVYSTPCGHIFHHTCVLQWLEKSKTCPQCRNRVLPTSLFRLFLNSQSNESFNSSDLDLTTLHNRVDNAEVAAKIAHKDLKEANQKVGALEQTNKNLCIRVKDLEARERHQDSAIFAYREQIRYYKQETQKNVILQDEIFKLRMENSNLNKFKLSLNGTYDEVKEMVRTETNVESLALITTTLKKSLVETNQEKIKLMMELKKCQNEVAQQRVEIDQLKKQVATTSSENQQQANERGRQIKRPFTAVSVNNEGSGSMRNEQNISIVDLTDTPSKSPDSLCPTTAVLAAHFNFYDNIKKKPSHTKIPAASSLGPYLLRRSQSCTRNNNAGQKLGHVFPNVTNNHNVKCTVHVQYNGLGGSSKDDPFPEPMSKGEPIIKRKKNMCPQFKNEVLLATALCIVHILLSFEVNTLVRRTNAKAAARLRFKHPTRESETCSFHSLVSLQTTQVFHNNKNNINNKSDNLQRTQFYSSIPAKAPKLSRTSNFGWVLSKGDSILRHRFADRMEYLLSISPSDYVRRDKERISREQGIKSCIQSLTSILEKALNNEGVELKNISKQDIVKSLNTLRDHFEGDQQDKELIGVGGFPTASLQNLIEQSSTRKFFESSLSPDQITSSIYRLSNLSKTPSMLNLNNNNNNNNGHQKINNNNNDNNEENQIISRDSLSIRSSQSLSELFRKQSEELSKLN